MSSSGDALLLSKLYLTASAFVVSATAPLVRRVRQQQFISSSDVPVFCLLLVLWVGLFLAFTSEGQGATWANIAATPFVALETMQGVLMALPDIFTMGQTVTGSKMDGNKQDLDALLAKLLSSSELEAQIQRMTVQQIQPIKEEMIKYGDLRMEELRKELLALKEEGDREERRVLEEKMKNLETAIEEKMMTDLGESSHNAENLKMAFVKLQEEKLRLQSELGGQHSEAEVVALKSELQDLENRVDKLIQGQNEFRQNIAKCCRSKEAIQMEITRLVDNLVEDIVSNSSANPSIKSFNAWLQDEYISKSAWETEVDRITKSIFVDIQSELVSIAGNEIRSGIRLSADQLFQNATFKEAIKSKITSELSASSHIMPEQEVKKIIDETLKIYDADKTGMFDFALETAGGTIASTRCTETHDAANGVYSVFGIPIWWERNSPRTILQPSSSPGQCWAFKGSTGAVVIRLSSQIRVKAVSMEHISKLIAPDNNIKSAPKAFTVLGLKALDDLEPVQLGNFTYSAESDRPVQTFFVDQNLPNVDQIFQLIELRVLNNYGNMMYTCLYRFRVHGSVEEN